jgi:WD40 repeat protein
VAFNPVKDAELCSVSIDGVVKFWDVRTKAVINEIKGLGEAFTLAWSPDGESLIVGNKVCFWIVDQAPIPNSEVLFTKSALILTSIGQQHLCSVTDTINADCFSSADCSD